MRETVQFNGVMLSDLYAIIGIHRPMPGMTNETQDISGYDGVKIVGSHMPSANITMRFIVKDMAELDRHESLHKLSALLRTNEPKQLKFGSDNGRYYMAMLDGEPELQQFINADVVNVTFLLERNVLYGPDFIEVSVPSGGSVTFTMNGTYVTRPIISGSSVRGSGGLWGLRLDDSDVIRASVSDTDTSSVTIDCEGRTLMVNDVLGLPTLQSDWFELEPGTHTISNDVGSGACTVTWQEMWI